MPTEERGNHSRVNMTIILLYKTISGNTMPLTVIFCTPKKNLSLTFIDIEIFCCSVLVLSLLSVSLFCSTPQYLLHFCPWWQCWVQITHGDRNPWNPVCETECKCLCIFGGYQLLINAVVSQRADRSILGSESTSGESSSDKELIKGGKRWIWFWGSVSNWAHERYWQGAEAAAALPY